MTSAIVNNLLAYSCALSLIAVCACLVAARARITSPRLLLAHFQLTLIVATVLPLLTKVWPARGGPAGVLPMVFSVTNGDPTRAAHPWLPAMVGGVIGLGIVLRVVWMTIGCVRLRTWRLRTRPLVALPPAIAAAQERICVRARWLVTTHLMGAVTYGMWNPIVLLPQRDFDADQSTLHLIACHELLHIRRRDWFFVVAEECLLTLLWFQPAIWVLVERIRLHREQLVDAAVIARTQESQNYARALLAEAGLEWPLSPQPASHWRRARHLRLRIQAIMHGGPMSRSSLLKWSGVFAGTLLLAGYSAVQAFPLQNSGGSQNDQHVYSSKDPGVVLPRIVREVKPRYTKEAMDAHIEGSVLLAVVVDAQGTVTDVQITESLDPTFGLDDQAVAAAWQWRFSPATKAGKPVAVSIALQLTFTLK